MAKNKLCKFNFVIKYYIPYKKVIPYILTFVNFLFMKINFSNYVSELLLWLFDLFMVTLVKLFSFKK